MEYNIEIKNNILYIIPLYLEHEQNVIVPISKIDILGPVTCKTSDIKQNSKRGSLYIYYSFSLAVGKEHLEIKTIIVNEDDELTELYTEKEILIEMRKKIVEAMEKQYSGYILDKPQKIKIKE